MEVVAAIARPCRAVTVVLVTALVGCADDDRMARPQPDVRYGVVDSLVMALRSRYPEAGDTAVRDQVLRATYCAVVEGQAVPTRFGMFSLEGDREVSAVVKAFVDRARSALRGRTRTERIGALWGASWKRDVYLTSRDCPHP